MISQPQILAMLAKRKFNEQKDFTFCDIDDCLIRSTAKVRVVSDIDRRIKTLSNSEFSGYNLKDGESYDFSEFRDANKFGSESTPLEPFFSKAKLLLNSVKNTRDHAFVFLTARSDLDNKESFLDTFRYYDMDVDSSHIERAGNLGMEPPPETKAAMVRAYITQYKPETVRMFDDSNSNLLAFLSLKADFPNVNFFAYKVDGAGLDNRFHPEDLNSKPDVLYERLGLLVEIIKTEDLISPNSRFFDSLDALGKVAPEKLLFAENKGESRCPLSP